MPTCEMLDKLLGNQCGVMVAWQLCAIVICLAGTVCSYISLNYDQTIPLLMLAMTYFIIFIVNVWWWPPSENKWWKYILVSIAGLAGDYTAVLAYNTTSLASAMLLVTTVIFWVAPLSFFVFGRKCNWKQILSMFLAIGGIVLVFVSDGTAGSHIIGNMLALGSAICYAISTVTQEKVVKDDSVRLYLCRFSACALPLALILSGAIEWKTIYNYNWCWQSSLLLVSYSVLLALYYMMVPIILQYSNATVMNLSSLTSNFYSLAISIFFFHSHASWLYLVGFLCIPIAITCYVLNEPKESKTPETLYSSLGE